jgi:hypothetical protein
MPPKIQITIALLALAFAPPASAQSFRSDLNGDGLVNGADLGIVLTDRGPFDG